MEDVLEYKRVIKPVISADAKWFPIIRSIEISYNTQGVLKIRDLQKKCDNEYLKSSFYTSNKGYSSRDIDKLFRYWNRWSDNDCRLGTPTQETFVRNWIAKRFGDALPQYKLKYLSAYNNELIDDLKKHNFYKDKNYVYGSDNKIFEKVPIDIIEFLFSLPEATGDSWSDIKLDLYDEEIVSDDDFNNLLFI